MLVALLVLTVRVAAQQAILPEPPPPSPGWVREVTGRYIGTVLNAGHLECHRTELSVQDGQLVGHYWIDDKQPFEGTLTGFVAESDTSGHFTWTDRYGSGIELLVFSADRVSFTGVWGSDRTDAHYPISAARGTACQPVAISLQRPDGRLPHLG